MSFSRSRRAISTRRPQVEQRRPMSAPSRTTRQVSPPHGCDLRSTTTSSRKNGSGPFARAWVMAAKSKGGEPLSGRGGERREVQTGLFGDREACAPVDELELSDDPTGARHRDVNDVRCADGADHPGTAHLMTIHRDRAVRRAGEVTLRSDADLIHRYRFGPGVAQLDHELRYRALGEDTLDLDP